MLNLKHSNLESNVRAHDKIAKKYERIHGEIYNDIEQERLRQSLKTALSHVMTKNQKKVVLDFGCGAGNLTRHVSALGCDVIAADVSQGFLDLVASRTYETEVMIVRLNGVDLSNIADGSVDMVAAYSVLHHVSDYLGILKEFMRVLKPMGVIYIDHELSESYWNTDWKPILMELDLWQKNQWKYAKYFVPANYFDWVMRRFINSRYRPEGDIHVFPDDHVEWKKIVDALLKDHGEILFEAEYLLFKRNYDIDVYNSYKDKINDMHLLVARKR